VPTRKIGQSCLMLPNSLIICKKASLSPFEIVTGQQPLTPSSLAISYNGPSPPIYKFAKDWNDQVGVARAYLEKAFKKMKKWADKRRRPREFQVGDLVLVKMYAHAWLDGRHRGLL